MERTDPRAIQWNETLTEALRRSRMNGETIDACADILGISRRPVMRRCRELGLNRRMNRGNMSSVRAVALRK